MAHSYKSLILTIFISISTVIVTNATTFYSIGGGKWSFTPGGPDCGITPSGVATDDIIVDRNDCPTYDAITGDPCEDQSGSSCVILNFTNFAGKITVKNGAMLVLTGAITIATSASITVDAGGLLKVNGSLSWAGGATTPTMLVNGVMHWRGSMSVYWPVTGTGYIKCCAAILIFNNGISFWGSVFGLGSVNCPGTAGTPPAPMPVFFNNLYAVPSFNSIAIHWTTAMETDNDYFSIERSVDGKEFIEIARVKGAGNSNTLLSYQYSDLNPILANPNYYRIRQTDISANHSTTSSVIIAELKKPAQQISIVPNPNPGNFSIHLSDMNGPFTIYISDLTGKMLKTFYFADNGNDQYLNLQDLNPGIYTLRVVNRDLSLHNNFQITH